MMRRALDVKMAPMSSKVQKGNTSNGSFRKTNNGGSTFEPLAGWDIEDDFDDLGIEKWAKEKYENHKVINDRDKPRPTSDTPLREKFLCIPPTKCSGIKDINDFKENSISEILKEKEEKKKEEQKVKTTEKEDDTCNNCKKNRTELSRAVTQTNLRSSSYVQNATLPNRAKSSNNLSLRSRSKLGLVYKKYVDEDEDQVSANVDGKLFRPRARLSANSSSNSSAANDRGHDTGHNVSRAQSSASFNPISEAPEGKRQREIKSAQLQRTVQIISPAVRLCYTQGEDPTRTTKGSVSGLVQRSKTMSDLHGYTKPENESEKYYDRCKSTSSDASSQDKTFVTNLKSKFTKTNQRIKKDDSTRDTKHPRNQSVKKHMSKLAKRQEQANADTNESDVPTLKLVLRKYSNESESEIDARLKRVQGIESRLLRAHPRSPRSGNSSEKHHTPAAQHKDADSILVETGEEPVEKETGDSVSVRFLQTGEEDLEEDSNQTNDAAIFPIGEILPDDPVGTLVAPPNGFTFRPYRQQSVTIDNDMKVTGRDLLVHQEEGLMLLQEGFELLRIKDKYGHQRHLGPPGFRPMSQKTPLHRARDSVQKRMNGKILLPQEVEDPTTIIRTRMPKLNNFSRESKRVQSAAANEVINGFGGRLSRRRRTLGDQAQDRSTLIDFQHARAKLQMGTADLLKRYQLSEDV